MQRHSRLPHDAHGKLLVRKRGRVTAGAAVESSDEDGGYASALSPVMPPAAPRRAPVSADDDEEDDGVDVLAFQQ
jgi:hypothetical protein